MRPELSSDVCAIPDGLLDPCLRLSKEERARLAGLRQASWQRHGKVLSCYLPGMYVRDGVRGRYPALSLTGTRCDQHCAHCEGKLLLSMPDVSTPERLWKQCQAQASRGALGILLSGGCDGLGRLPWEEFLPVIARVREELDLHVSVHSGLITREIARGLACAGVEQVLLDVIGSPATYREVYGLENGPMALYESLEVITQAGLSLVPHIVAGLHFGCLVGEYEALRIVKGFMPEVLVVVVLMNLKGTRMAHVTPPGAEDLKDFFARAREELPDTILSLGCARSRRDSTSLEQLALLAGFNRMALPSDETLELARAMGVRCSFQATCCSVAPTLRGGWQREPFSPFER